MMDKRKRHSPEQIVRKLEDADRRLTAGQSIAQVCQALEVREAVGARTPEGVRVDTARCGGDLSTMPKVGPYDARMLEPIDCGLIARVDVAKTWVCGIYWEGTSHVTDHHPADCLHSIVNIGGVPAHGKRALRGKIYWFEGTLEELLATWRTDFPRG